MMKPEFGVVYDRHRRAGKTHEDAVDAAYRYLHDYSSHRAVVVDERGLCDLLISEGISGDEVARIVTGIRESGPSLWQRLVERIKDLFSRLGQALRF